MRGPSFLHKNVQGQGQAQAESRALLTQHMVLDLPDLHSHKHNCGPARALHGQWEPIFLPSCKQSMSGTGPGSGKTKQNEKQWVAQSWLLLVAGGRQHCQGAGEGGTQHLPTLVWPGFPEICGTQDDFRQHTDTALYMVMLPQQWESYSHLNSLWNQYPRESLSLMPVFYEYLLSFFGSVDTNSKLRALRKQY